MAGAGSRRDAAEARCFHRGEPAELSGQVGGRRHHPAAIGKISPDPPRMTCTSRDADGGAGKSRPSKEKKKKALKIMGLLRC